MKVGRRVAFKVSKARVSFPRKESYGLEARFKVTNCCFSSANPPCWMLDNFLLVHHVQVVLSLLFLQVWVESEELEALRRAAIQRAPPR